MWATMKYVSETWMSIGTMPSITPEMPPITKVDDEAEREQHRRR